jgi:hypothetical protein
VPDATDWTDRGAIFTAGVSGDWDLYLWGGFAISAVKHDGMYFLYYQGSDGYDDVEATVTHRAIGVATSSDGLSFTKHPGNPVLTYLPTSSIEEGAASGGAFITASGDVGMYYGANEAFTPSQVHADVRYAHSADGISFTDQGVVLDHSDTGVWGFGDELFGVFGVAIGGQHIAFYIPNGSAERGRLGVAWGPGTLGLNTTSEVLAAGVAVDAWGPASAARLEGDRYAVFINNNADSHAGANHIDVYEMDPTMPGRFTGPVRTYAPANFSRGVVLLDESTDTWFLYHRNADASAYRVSTAPVMRW